jgi:hypothetical protein
MVLPALAHLSTEVALNGDEHDDGAEAGQTGCAYLAPQHRRVPDQHQRRHPRVMEKDEYLQRKRRSELSDQYSASESYKVEFGQIVRHQIDDVSNRRLVQSAATQSNGLKY